MPITQSCVTTTEAWLTTGCADGVQISTGWAEKPDYTEAHQADYLVCASAPDSPVSDVEDLGVSTITIDGHSAEYAEWLATCSNGDSFRLEEVWVAGAGVFLSQHTGIAHLDELAEGLSLTGGSPDTVSSLLVVDDLGQDSWSGEIQVWDTDVLEGSAFLPTCERQTVDLAGVTCLGGGTAPGLEERVVECGDLAAELDTLGPGNPLRVISAEDGTVLTVGIQYQA